ncbi:MAG: class I SAM-dependent methyltransferase [Desulfobacterales bacterium]|nr:class I SAM-dependent methyltransferase [Desulfofustis sp.]NNK96449.1 class I SAM-dependent methyltransferase [Desulfobacterales bacterium]
MTSKINNYFFNKIANLLCCLLQRDDIQHSVTKLFHKILNDKYTHQLFPQIFHKLLLDDVSREVIADTISNELIRKQLWKNINIRPGGNDFSYAFIPNSLIAEVHKLATLQSAEYIDQKMPQLFGHDTPLDLLSYCIKEATVDGNYLEFGVFSGYTINHISSMTDQVVHGFDSFRGLPEDWGTTKKGKFSTNGNLPSVNENVILHVGLFEETLPGFIAEHDGNISFMHIDSDLYSSAHTVLFSLKNKIVSNTIIVFDEYFNYPGWQHHEYKAFQEFIEETGMKYEYIAYAGIGFSVGVKIL